ncbi:MAG TPA: hypothetical protein VNP72_05015 [Longimicrobium sp.]|nr:hypothetical protein [Longimicrobium sp.]
MAVVIGLTTLALLLGLCGWLAAAAQRSEHLIVLRVHSRGTFFLARQADGRFRTIHPIVAPLEVARFTGMRVAASWMGLRAALARPWRWRWRRVGVHAG